MARIECVDFSSLRVCNFSNVNDWKTISDEVVKSLKEMGFLYIKNHGISQHLIDQIHAIGEEFFALPSEIKSLHGKTLWSKNGYMEINRENFNKDSGFQELRESYDISLKKDVFPSVVDDFKMIANDLIDEGTKLAYKLMTCIEIGLDLPMGCLVKAHNDLCSETNQSCLRIIHYPPIPQEVTEGAVRCGAHSDYGTITLLFQDSMGGLEVKNRQGKWVKADPIPGTILVNVGDMLQMWTQKQFIATKHKVIVPKEEIRRRSSRRSVVFFVNPDLDVTIQPFNGATTQPPITCDQYLKFKFANTYQY